MSSFIKSAKTLLLQPQKEDIVSNNNTKDVPLPPPLPKEIKLTDPKEEDTKEDTKEDDSTAEVTDESSSVASLSKSTTTTKPNKKFTQLDLDLYRADPKAIERSVNDIAAMGRRTLANTQEGVKLGRENNTMLVDIKKEMIVQNTPKKKYIEEAKHEKTLRLQAEAALRRRTKELEEARQGKTHNHVKSSKPPAKDGKVVAVKNMDKHVKNQAPGAGEEKAKENARKAGRLRH